MYRLNCTLSDDAGKQLSELADHYNLSKRAIVALAVERMFYECKTVEITLNGLLPAK